METIIWLDGTTSRVSDIEDKNIFVDHEGYHVIYHGKELIWRANCWMQV